MLSPRLGCCKRTDWFPFEKNVDQRCVAECFLFPLKKYSVFSPEKKSFSRWFPVGFVCKQTRHWLQLLGLKQKNGLQIVRWWAKIQWTPRIGTARKKRGQERYRDVSPLWGSPPQTFPISFWRILCSLSPFIPLGQDGGAALFSKDLPQGKDFSPENPTEGHINGVRCLFAFILAPALRSAIFLSLRTRFPPKHLNLTQKKTMRT